MAGCSTAALGGIGVSSTPSATGNGAERAQKKWAVRGGLCAPKRSIAVPCCVQKQALCSAMDVSAPRVVSLSREFEAGITHTQNSSVGFLSASSSDVHGALAHFDSSMDSSFFSASGLGASVSMASGAGVAACSARRKGSTPRPVGLRPISAMMPPALPLLSASPKPWAACATRPRAHRGQ
eukprot:scaffold22752_cov52-Phaeocystis_antarctica.AAC.11